ncbi:hypothetical protein FQN60_012405 [Etheostoma spectabile]|uniref:GTF3C1 extended winged-helix domain-containing protein n=1 Tax=Etheostoma spectabile TaxID=54343 RepID=A0A5J5DPS6_9PERO|nr:hypothetical protein FQN60_012405 [Etheostoma spectabile]
MRKALVRHGLLSMQSYVTRLKSGSQAGQQQHSILLLLKRFHVNRRTKYDILMEYVSNFLQQSPGQFSTMLTLKDLLNVDEGTFKRVFQYMRSAKLVEYCQYPLEDLDPGAGPCTNKKGNKVLVRCLRLLKPYTGKSVAEDDDDEDEDEDDDGAARRQALPSEGQIMESDVLTQAYHIVISCGPKGIPQRGIVSRMNVGKLESRMICRRLEREGLIKGFMEDEGRQRTTKFISHKCFGVSDKLQQFAKEQERKKLLYSSAPQTSDAAPPTPTTPPMSKAKENSKTSAAKKVKKAVRGRNKDAEEAEQTCSDGEEDTAAEGLVGKEGEAGGNGTSAGEKSSVETNRTQPDIPIVQLTPAESDTPACSNSTTSVTLDSVSPTPTAEQARVEDEESNSSTASTLLQSELLNADDNPVENNIVLVKDVCKPRKIINDDEKQDGSSSKCCKKTIIRLVDSLSREGLLKVYKTTIIQDGITKNIEMVVHPSFSPKMT